MMVMDDVIYIALLMGCIGFGPIYRLLNNERVTRKRWIGSAVGFLLIVIVSGYHVVHVMLTFAVATLIVLAFDVRQAHVLTFVFMFGYLLFFRMTDYFNIPSPPGQANLIQMMFTLKIVGLAFERNAAAKDLAIENQKTFANEEDRNISAIKKAYWEDILDLNVEDVFHYCFNYVAVLTGPYFTYRTFRDYFTARYWQYVNCELLMMQRFKWVAVYAAFFLSCSYVWPINYALSDEFYYERSFLYRIWYVFPSFFVFRMRIYIGLTLSECVCIMSGFGAYPQPFRSRPGGGPRDVIALDKPVAESQFDFETIHNFDVQTTESCLTVREAMRSYQMCIQYWLATVVYQRIPNKTIRTVATLAVSAFWQGCHAGYFISMLGVPLYLPVESMWEKMISQKSVGTKKKIIEGVFWFSKTFVMSYLGMAFLLMTTEKIQTFYKSVYYLGYFWIGSMYLVGLLVQQQMKTKSEPPRQRSVTPGVSQPFLPKAKTPSQPVESSPAPEVVQPARKEKTPMPEPAPIPKPQPTPEPEKPKQE